MLMLCYTDLGNFPFNITFNVLFMYFQDMGTILLGKVESGVVAKNDNILLMPNRVSTIISLMVIFLNDWTH